MNPDPSSSATTSNQIPISFEPFTFVFERLANLLTNELKYLCTDKVEEIKSLQQGVEVAQNLLKDVDEVQRQANINHELQIKVRQLMGVLDEIEDFLDSQAGGGDGDTSLFSSFSFGSLKRKRSVVKGAQEIKEKLNEVVQCLKGYQLSGDSPYVIPRPRYRTQPDNFKEEFIVDLKEDVKTYVAELVTRKGKNHESLAHDLAIFGMGGAGKTTIARLLYRNKQILKHFKKLVWVCVSQQWDKTKLLHQISQQVGMQPPNDDDDGHRLVSMLKGFLSRTSCFFVLDDVWDVKALLELLPILRSANSIGRTNTNSRVLVTTRNKEIFNFPQNDFSAYKIRPLTPSESQILFAKTIHRNRRDGWNFEGEFVKLGDEMLEKCGGLPLAIVALGGLLSSKDTIQEWESINNDVVRRIMRHKGSDDDYGVVTEILELSYFDLPYWLKPCFLYFGIFPEDSIIEVQTLIQLWIAEGFVKVDQSSSSKTLEKVAMDILDELANRCMVEVVKKGYGGELIHIQIHDLMRDLCIRKAEDSRLFEVLPSPASSSTSMDLKSCRIIFQGQQTSINIKSQSFKVRSSFVFQRESKQLPLVQMKYLRVLFLKGIDLEQTSTQLGELILLRHLQLDRCNVSMANLVSIKRLRNLVSFIYLDYNQLPENLVGGMDDLRHLRISSPEEVSELGVFNKSNLQTLKAYGGEWLTKELPYASINLQELTLSGIKSAPQLEAVYAFVSNRCHRLHKLFLVPGNPALEIDLSKLKPRHCATLHLSGRVKPQPVLEFPCRLLKLCLVNTRIGGEIQLKEALAQLDELRYLELEFNAFDASVLSMIGLLKLQQLRLRHMSDLKEWKIGKGGLTRLQKLEIDNCENLQRLPQEMRHINLKHLILESMPSDFVKRLDAEPEGEDFCLVRHIPSVEFKCYTA